MALGIGGRGGPREAALYERLVGGRAAILEAEALAIGAVRYLTPLLTLGWLAAFSLAGAAYIWLFALGGALVALSAWRYRGGAAL